MVVFSSPAVRVADTTATYADVLTTGAPAEHIALIAGLAAGMLRDGEMIAVDSPAVKNAPSIFITPAVLGLQSLGSHGAPPSRRTGRR